VRGIPALVVLDAQGQVVHSDASIDARSLVAQHGAAAFPLSSERVKDLRKGAKSKAEEINRLKGGGVAAFFQSADGSDDWLVRTRSAAPSASAAAHLAPLSDQGIVGVYFSGQLSGRKACTAACSRCLCGLCLSRLRHSAPPLTCPVALRCSSLVPAVPALHPTADAVLRGAQGAGQAV